MSVGPPARVMVIIFSSFVLKIQAFLFNLLYALTPILFNGPNASRHLCFRFFSFSFLFFFCLSLAATLVQTLQTAGFAKGMQGFFFFSKASRPQKPYGLLGTGGVGVGEGGGGRGRWVGGGGWVNSAPSPG